MKKSIITVTAFLNIILLSSFHPVSAAEKEDESTTIKKGTEVYGEDISELTEEELQYVPEGWRDGVVEDDHIHDPIETDARNIQSVYPDVNNYISSRNLATPSIEFDHKSVFPTIFFRYGKPEGVVAHETANNSSTITGEISYMTRNYKNAFVHAFVDDDRVIEIHPTKYASWGAGRYANERFIHVELVRVHTFNEFARSVNNYATYIASLLHKHDLGVVSAEYNGTGTLWSHNAVSRFLGGTTHTDPIGYFSKWGYSWEEFVMLVGEKYNDMATFERTSKLGHIRSKQVRIYQDPLLKDDYETAGTEYTNHVYYIKQQLKKGTEVYYLISKKPSSSEGTVGWVNSKDMQVYSHVGVDRREKEFEVINGSGKAYNRAWGGSKNLVYSDLYPYLGNTFLVNLTEEVGNNTWYRGYLAGKQVWIHSNHLEEKIRFIDVASSSSHYDGIYALVDMEAITGYPLQDGSKAYRPEQEVSRSHAAVIFTRALNIPTPSNVSSILDNYSDISSSHDYANQIAATYKEEIFRGNNGRFMDGPLTREQMATVIANAFELEDIGVETGVNLENVSPSHKKNVDLLAQHGITVALDDYRPSETVTRGQFATFIYRAIQK
ncbi:SH3-like domain-containing protein [Oceanobacillus limi]|uniref:Autolysin n=1 Tax=Oceanobacillus limi TaxID=930131 RepID=A0A1I0A1Q3_9BACI|nr:S-layer homology domain-containing protein [Oceanobacillus limi]SES88057.1 SH3-like domain-containing protein [Oceanobacillus limi]